VPIKTTCPGCGRGVKAPSRHAGRAVRCPDCAAAFTLAPPVREPREGPSPPEMVKMPDLPEVPDLRRRPRESVEGAPPAKPNRWAPALLMGLLVLLAVCGGSLWGGGGLAALALRQLADLFGR
jgi:hypothetical protein